MAKKEWVTVRNALAHGSAYFDPSVKKIVFKDVKRSISWSLERTYLEGCDVFLANVAMLHMLDFILLARVRILVGQIDLLRSIVGDI